MKMLKILALLALVLGVSACSSSKFKTYNGPEVTRVVVWKDARKMRLYHHDKVLEEYEINLGFAPSGHKNFEGDGRTPEGRYLIDRRNPNSRFHLSLGISYPNVRDIAAARVAGKDPGGDIFIHGRPNPLKRDEDWNWGCIAVSNREMEWIYAMVRNGTVIDIYP
ncbi:ErfK/YbiS/YcfS/YnhG family protein [Candidatus Rhodobacter oscarellae]|uniref:ErfK/YbiS/YcfS/YnhG family protein n=1 Tax=Candidatus Rhodobacter oscarellae TaxID=1675527 RepID=A0A0J9EB20_9RHOB|nr:L,D-transpeptidase family protein [Candidatus Rhodobacter lobularis]KMW58874.1 ErfK/YbiS/YcfS/YnhG family protein [Candidatus Rhodobacter lobularis]